MKPSAGHSVPDHGVHCHLCGAWEDDPQTYRAADDQVALVCLDCAEQRFICPQCKATHDAKFPGTLCRPCAQEAQEIWNEEHPTGEPHFYEYSPAMRPCGRRNA